MTCFKNLFNLILIEAQENNIDPDLNLIFQSKTPSFISIPNPAIRMNENASINQINAFEPSKIRTDHGKRKATSMSNTKKSRPIR